MSKEFYEQTKNKGPSSIITEFLRLEVCPGKAIDLGCGAGRDSIALLKNNWNVLAIDRENSVEDIIKENLPKEKLDKFKFEVQNFEALSIEESDLIIAINSLPFCKKNFFDRLWNTINDNIKSEGYFVGTFFGVKDDWVKTKEQMSFLTEEEIFNLFKEYKLIKSEGIEKDEKTALGIMKHWHIYEIIAKKI